MSISSTSFLSYNIDTPNGNLLLVGDILYGTSQSSSNNQGSIFSFNRITNEIKELYEFMGGVDGSRPSAGLVYDSITNTLYGTCYGGGTSGYGTIFGYVIGGDNTPTSIGLYSFTNGIDGSYPLSSLVLDSTTNTLLYGTCSSGSDSNGTIFSFNKNTNDINILYSFTNGIDGTFPLSLVLDSTTNTLYGTCTYGGGDNNLGTIFGYKIGTSPDSIGLYSFTNGTDGAKPQAGLTLDGTTLYGTCTQGGTSGNGTIFGYVINESCTGLYSFTNGTNGANPIGGLVLNNSILYGTCSRGGNSNAGTLFEYNIDISSIISHLLKNTGIMLPLDNLILVNNLLYGTSNNGGDNGLGTIFSFNKNTNTINKLYSFTNGTDGSYPYAGLVYDISTNTLYGTCNTGGTSGNGTIFGYVIGGDNTSIGLYSFTGNLDGSYPYAGLVLVGTTLYGTCSQGGTREYGTIFGYVIGGDNTPTSICLYTFTGDLDGAYPYAGLVLDSITNTLYGTCNQGGTSGNGTIFGYVIDGTCTGLYSFKNDGSDGSYPTTGLVYNILTNTLYGTCPQGGIDNLGTIFGYIIGTSPSSIGLYSFTNGTDGAKPQAGLTLDGTTLYGTCSSGGTYIAGTIFKYVIGGACTGLYSFKNGSDGGIPLASLLLDNNILYGTCSIGGDNSGGTIFSYTLSLPCFNTGTLILCNNNTYIPVEDLKIGDTVKTRFGYKKIVNIGTTKMYSYDKEYNEYKKYRENNDKEYNDKNQMCKLSMEFYPELFEDLYITGAHSILVNYIDEQERKDIIKMLGKIYVTDKLYRLPACLDKNSTIVEGIFTIYHIALENENYYGNYGIYANGLLVETCSIRFLNELSNMKIIK